MSERKNELKRKQKGFRIYEIGKKQDTRLVHCQLGLHNISGITFIPTKKRDTTRNGNDLTGLTSFPNPQSTSVLPRDLQATPKTILEKLSFNEKYCFSSQISLKIVWAEINQFPHRDPKKSFTDFLIMVFYVTLELGGELRGENAFVANFQRRLLLLTEKVLYCVIFLCRRQFAVLQQQQCYFVIQLINERVVNQ